MTRGFTLVELLIVVAIVALLASVAIPGYNQYVKKSHEAKAINQLGDIRTSQVSYREDPAGGNGHYAASIQALRWRTDDGKTVGSPPANYAFSTDAQATQQAVTDNRDDVIHQTIRLDRQGNLSFPE